VFETWVISELLKGIFNRGMRDNIYFWRDNIGHEMMKVKSAYDNRKREVKRPWI